jgi:hypothetical protein
MYSFRKEDPAEEVPTMSLDDNKALARVSKRSSLFTSDSGSMLPIPSVQEHEMHVCHDSTQQQLDSQQLGAVQGVSRSLGDPFRFVEFESMTERTVGDPNVTLSPANMSPTLRSALLSCSSFTGSPSTH